MRESIKAEPFKNKVIEPIPVVLKAKRAEALALAGYNPYLLSSGDVPLDLLANNGLVAMSDRQWAGLMVGDEAYAGSRSFYLLEKSVREIFGHHYLIPAHLGRGALHLAALVMLPEPGKIVLCNKASPLAILHFQRRGAEVLDIGVVADPQSNDLFRGDVDIETLVQLLDQYGDRVSLISLACCPEGMGSFPIGINNFKKTAAIAREYNIRVLLDISCFASWAYLVREHETDQSFKSLKHLVSEMASCADVMIMSAKEGCFSNVGGFLLTKHEDVFVALRSVVVVYEGLHTYGGMAGRDMEAVALGLLEMLDASVLNWHKQQIALLGDNLKRAGVPVIEPYGASGVFIDALRFVPHIPYNQFPAQTVAAAIYKGTGVRATEHGQVAWSGITLNHEGQDSPLELVGLHPPHRVYKMAQLKAAAEAISEVYRKSSTIRGLNLIHGSSSFSVYGARFTPCDPMGIFNESINDPQENKLDYKPYRTKVIEFIELKDRSHREKVALEAGYNTFLMRSEDVYLDLLTDSGTSAMSAAQWGAMIKSDESSFGSLDWPRLEKAVQDIFGFKYVLPVHQGRAGEHILSQIMIKDGDWIPGNMYFTTTREHQEMAGGNFVDVIVDEAHEPISKFQWKGNVDIKKLQNIINKVGADKIPYISYETSVNMAGGQPISMNNAKEVSQICKANDIAVMYDATRCAENAYLIKKNDPAYANISIREILRELMSYGDGCTISSKKDNLVNIGSFIACNQEWVYEKAKQMLPVFEGNLTSGGMAGRDMAALARGIYEMVEDSYIRSRVEQTLYLGQLLLDAGIPIMEPPGSHAVFLDAKRFLPHLDQDQYPAQTLAAELYIESGVRAMERGNVSTGREKKTGKNKRPKLELVRLTIPRRVYSREQMRYCAEAVKSIWQRRDSIKGLNMVFEPPQLRFFTARFERL